MCWFSVNGDRILHVTQPRLDLLCLEDVAILGSEIRNGGGDLRLHSNQSGFIKTGFERSTHQHFIIGTPIKVACIQKRDTSIKGSVNRSNAFFIIDGTIHPRHPHTSQGQWKTVGPWEPS
jgi:hypothetical protein